MGGKLSKQVGAVVFGRIIVAAIDSLKAFLLVRLLTKDAYGALAFTLAWRATAMGLGTLGIPDSLLYFLPRSKQGAQRSLVRQSLLLLGVVGLGIGLIIAIVALIPSLLPLDRPDMSPALLCIAVAVVLDLPSAALASFLLGTERHRTSALVAMGLSLLANASLLLPAWSGASLVQILVAYDVMAALRLAVTWIVWWRVFRDVDPAPFAGGLRTQLNFSIPLSLNGLAGLVNKYFATYVAGWLLAAAAYADFAVGSQELPFVGMVPYAVAVAVLPRLSQLAGASPDGVTGARDALTLWHSSIERVALIMLPLGVFCLVEAEALLTVCYEARYRSAALPFRISAMLLPLRVTSYGTMLMALGRPRWILRAQLSSMAFNAMATVPLLAWVHFAATQGPDPQVRMAWMCAVSVSATYVGVWVMMGEIGRQASVSIIKAFPWPGYLRRAGLAALAGVPLVLWQLWLPEPSGALAQAGVLALRLLLYVGLYLGLVLGAGLVPPDDRKVLGQWLRLEPLWRR